MSVPSLKAHFDEFAADYDRALARGLSLSGEDKDFFARGRLAWLSDCLRELGEAPKSVLDFGCGTGSASRYLLDLPAVQRVVGVDISAKCIEVARHSFGSERAQFVLQAEYDPRGEMDLAFCNGVFHHIPVIERANAVNYTLLDAHRLVGAQAHRPVADARLHLVLEDGVYLRGLLMVVQRHRLRLLHGDDADAALRHLDV